MTKKIKVLLNIAAIFNSRRMPYEEVKNQTSWILYGVTVVMVVILSLVVFF